MKVVIFGASGRTGRHLVEQCLAKNWCVTAFVREPRRLKVASNALRVVRGDVLDPAAVASAVAGQDAVLCALGHMRWLYPNRILSQGTSNIVAAMARHGVQRIVCLSSLGVGDSFGRLGLYYTLFVVPFILPFYYWDKARQEDVLSASSSEWTVVRPGLLTNRAARGRWRSGAKLGNWIWPVSIGRADLATFMLRALGETEVVRRTIAVAY